MMTYRKALGWLALDSSLEDQLRPQLQFDPLIGFAAFVFGKTAVEVACDVVKEREEKAQRRSSPKDWLSNYLLQHGPTRRSDVVDVAMRRKICSASALDRAAASLKLPKGWYWRLPE
jgi:hypothetical protein